MSESSGPIGAMKKHSLSKLTAILKAAYSA
jgi:hypothetical protein